VDQTFGPFDWTITKSISGAAPTVVRQEIKPVLLSGTYSEIVATKGDSFDIRYSLNIKENNATIL
jgi:hypothetical protein